MDFEAYVFQFLWGWNARRGRAERHGCPTHFQFLWGWNTLYRTVHNAARDFLLLSIPLRMKLEGVRFNGNTRCAFNSFEDETRYEDVHENGADTVFQFLWGWNPHDEWGKCHPSDLSIPLRMKRTKMGREWPRPKSLTFNSFEDETCSLRQTRVYHRFVSFNSFEDETSVIKTWQLCPVILDFQFLWGWNSSRKFDCSHQVRKLSIPLRMKPIELGIEAFGMPSIAFNSFEDETWWCVNPYRLHGIPSFNSFEDETILLWGRQKVI